MGVHEAVRKINEEIQKEPNNRYLALVGEHIIDRIITDADAEKVLQEGKTLMGALQEVEKKALERAVGDATKKQAVMESAEVFQMVEGYFSLNPQGSAEKKSVSLSLEDFL